MTSLDDFQIDVKHEEKPREKELIRRWVSIVEPGGVKLLKPRSVILCAGRNHLQLTWKPKQLRGGVGARACLYVRAEDETPIASSHILNPQVIDVNNFVSVHWDVDVCV